MTDKYDSQRDAVHLVTVGPFGQAVASALQEIVAAHVTPAGKRNETTPALWPLARINVLVSWRPVPRLYQLCDAVSYAWKRPWFPVVLEDQMLRIGPVVVPGQGACHGCYEKRVLQHSARQALYRALNEHYEAHPESGPQGFLPAIAEIAALRAAQLIEQLESEPASEAGWLWQMDILTRRTLRSQVIGVHDCPRCGLQRDLSTRSYAALREELRTWLPWQSLQTERSAQHDDDATHARPRAAALQVQTYNSQGGEV
jgi:bacteriocin biosynthesis cyclodehydratase domain-containing protein